MSTEKRLLHLNLFIHGVGHHEAAWRHSKSNVQNEFDFSFFKEVVVKAEQAKFDSIFLADYCNVSKESIQYGALGVGGLDPVTLLSALSSVTEKIGLIGTLSTSFNEPYNVARRFASLDHLSGGRSGWNVVTSGLDAEARNFNLDFIPEHSERYRRAEEFVNVTKKLWDSWEDAAVIRDQVNGIYADINKVHEINHAGEFFKVQGPLSNTRSPQGQPVIVQAGSSERGIDFGAKYAELVFTAQQTLKEAQQFYANIKEKAAEYGRSSDSILILPGICPIVGETEAEAKEKEAQLYELINYEHSLRKLSQRTGVDLTGYPLDGPFPDLADFEDVNGHKSRSQLIKDLARGEDLTIRQLLIRLAGGRGHQTITGTPKQIADELEERFITRGADGFNVMPQLLKEGFNDFITMVVPELQRRGLFRMEYESNTLRGHFGLSRPTNQFQGIQQV